MISCVEGHEGVVKLVLDREDTDIRLKDKDGRLHTIIVRHGLGKM
jgi:hypothetical protein